MKKSLSLLLFVLSSHLLSAQSIQWAEGIYHHFNLSKENGFQPEAILGLPDAPLGTVDTKAVKLVTQSGYGSIVVTFDPPTPILNVILVESNHPGNVVNVGITDEEGLDYTIYKGHAKKVKSKNRVLIIKIPSTDYLVKRIKIDINTGFNPGWAQLDAVGISHSPSSVLRKELSKFGNYFIEEVRGTAGVKESLGAIINTRYDEINPIISQDGQTLYFTRAEDPSNHGGNKDFGDIYYSTLVNNSWSLPKNIGEPINNNAPNGVSSVSTDGNSLLLINSYTREDLEAGIDLSLSHRDETGWSIPEGIVIKGLKNKSQFVDYFIGSNSRVMILSIEEPNGFGDQDLYVSFHQDDDTWSVPLNLGSVINTVGADFSPFLASDGKTLYFSSYNSKGYGESDIYYAKRLDNSWKKWSDPVNLGESINTPGFDGYYSITADGRYAYFVSNFGTTKSSRDIFRIELEKKFKPEPVLLITGKVLNKFTNKPVQARIVFEFLENGKEEGVARSNPSTGEYSIILPAGHKYGYYAQAEGFVAENANINNVDHGKFLKMTKDLYLVPIENERSFVMNNIFFETAKWDLLPESYPELNRLVTILSNAPDITIEVSGHTDNTGSHETNTLLSLQRANAVKGYLTTKGISDGRISATGIGSSAPIGSNETESGRAKNRRVEVKFKIL